MHRPNEKKQKSKLTTLGNTVASGLNLTAGVMGFSDTWRLQNKADLYKRFHPDEIDAAVQNTRAYRGRPPTSIVGIRDQFTTCTQNAANANHTTFADRPLGQAMTRAAAAGGNRAANAAIVNTGLDTALNEVDRSGVAAVTTDFNHLVEFLQNKKSTYTPAMLPAYIAELRTRATEAFTTQLANEKAAITACFNRANFQAALDIADPDFANPPNRTADERASIQNNLIAALEAKHKAAIDAFEKSFAESEKQLTTEVQSDTAELHFLNLLLNEERADDEQRNRLKALCRRMAAEQDGEQQAGIAIFAARDESVPVVQGALAKFVEEGSADHKHTFKTAAGTPMVYDTLEQSITLQPPKRYNFTYWDDVRDTLSHDLNEVVMAHRARGGSDKITLSITHQALDLEAESAEDRDKNQASLRMKVARKAFDACLLQGFEPDKITITINDKKFTQAELFKNHLFASKNMQDRSAEWGSLRKNIDTKHKQTDVLKQQIADSRQRIEAEAAAAAEAAENNQNAAENHI